MCEENSSGIDRVVPSAEVSQLAVSNFRVASSCALVILYGSWRIENKDRDDWGWLDTSAVLSNG